MSLRFDCFSRDRTTPPPPGQRPLPPGQFPLGQFSTRESPPRTTPPDDFFSESVILSQGWVGLAQGKKICPGSFPCQEGWGGLPEGVVVRKVLASNHNFCSL